MLSTLRHTHATHCPISYSEVQIVELAKCGHPNTTQSVWRAMSGWTGSLFLLVFKFLYTRNGLRQDVTKADCELNTSRLLIDCDRAPVTLKDVKAGRWFWLRRLEIEGKTEFPPAICCKLPNLRHLWLERNGIRAVAPEMGRLTGLWEMGFKLCWHLKTISPEIGQLARLRTIVFDTCPQIQQLPETVGGLVSLQSLTIRYCRSLEVIPDGVSKLSSLRFLSFDNCASLQVLPPGFGNLSGLETLSFKWCNALRTVPVGGMVNLKSLLFANCRALHAAPAGIGRLECLVELTFDWCGIVVVPKEIGLLPLLSVLVFSICGMLVTVPVELSNVREVLFSSCVQLSVVPREVVDMATFHWCPLVN